MRTISVTSSFGGSGVQQLIRSVSPAVSMARRMGVGINLDGYFESVTPGLWGHTYMLADLATVKAAGFKHVRLPIRWDTHTSQEYMSTIDESFFLLIDSFVQECANLGLICIIDVHHFRSLEGDSPDLEETWVPPANSGPERLKLLWRQIAARYSNDAHVVFDIYNEPHNAFNETLWFNTYREIRNDIRRTHPTRILMLSCSHYAAHWDTWSVPYDLFDHHTILKVHFYHPSSFTHQQTPVTFGPPNVVDLTTEMVKAPQWRTRYPFLGLAIGEYGCVNRRNDGSYVTQADRLFYAQTVAQQADAAGFDCRCWWGFKGTWGMYQQPIEGGSGNHAGWTPGFLSAIGIGA